MEFLNWVEADMRLLVTAGNTQTPIDRVRSITNIFSGRTGAQDRGAGLRPRARGYAPHVAPGGPLGDSFSSAPRCARFPRSPVPHIRRSRRRDGTGDSRRRIRRGDPRRGRERLSCAGVYTQRDGRFVDASAGKVKSSHPELWLKLVPTPKLVDKVRSEWGFAGCAGQVQAGGGALGGELREVAEQARVQSRADLMVANTLEGMNDWALVGGEAGYAKVPREELARALIEAVEERVSGRG